MGNPWTIHGQTNVGPAVTNHKENHQGDGRGNVGKKVLVFKRNHLLMRGSQAVFFASAIAQAPLRNPRRMSSVFPYS